MGGWLDNIDTIETVFVDTITKASWLSFHWAKLQPESFTERGKFDLRAAYGLHARELMLWANHLQHARALNIIYIGVLESATDDYGRTEHRLQAEGRRVPAELPGVVDQVITMNWIDFGDGKPAQRAFVCTSPNPWAWPAKDRSGRLNQLEPPDLGALIAKALPPRASHQGVVALDATVNSTASEGESE